MLTTEWTKPLTVEMLWDIVDSQRTSFGDKQLVTKPELEHCIELIANGESIMRCMDNDSMKEDNWKLNYLESRLKHLSKNVLQSVITVNGKIDVPFQVGFYCETEGFIEVISSDEIAINETP